MRYGSLCACAIHPIHSHSSLSYRETYKFTTTCQRLPQFMHTTPQKCENGFLFIRLGLPSTRIRRGNGTFWKRIWKRRLCVLVWTKNRAFHGHDNYVISLTGFSSNTDPTWLWLEWILKITLDTLCLLHNEVCLEYSGQVVTRMDTPNNLVIFTQNTW